jgi:c-di-GMP-binding flagellar brake protein YcgR
MVVLIDYFGAKNGGEMANQEKELKQHFGIAKFEERAHPRFLLNLPVEYYPAASTAQGKGYTGNASEGGLIVYLGRHLQVGDLLKLRLFFSSGPGMNSVNTVEMVSQVIWTEKLKDSEYRCGIKFVDISAEDMNKLSSFLKNLSPISH